jgi:hypothetical protein
MNVIAGILLFLSFVSWIGAVMGFVNPKLIKGNPSGSFATFSRFAAFAIGLGLVGSWLESPTSTASPAIDAGGRLPLDERAFIEAVQKAAIAYRSAPNEMAAGGFRSARARAICAVLPDKMAVSNWIGKVQTLTANEDGKGVISISLADDISIGTWNNSISDFASHTLIEPATSLFTEASSREVGESVMFSADLFASGSDCIEEKSMTLNGSMTSPDFLARFTEVEALGAKAETPVAAYLPQEEAAAADKALPPCDHADMASLMDLAQQMPKFRSAGTSISDMQIQVRDDNGGHKHCTAVFRINRIGAGRIRYYLTRQKNGEGYGIAGYLVD